MRAVLVIDEMPTDCIKCPLADGYCWNTFPTKGRADECPLKLMPEKKSVELACQKEEAGNEYGAGLIVGWNDCIRELEENE